MHKRAEFQSVMDRGRKRRVEKLFTVFRVPNGLTHSRLGIITSRKIGNACARNRTRRRIREIVRRVKHQILPPMDIVVIAGKGMVPLPFSILEKKLADALAPDFSKSRRPPPPRPCAD